MHAANALKLRRQPRRQRAVGAGGEAEALGEARDVGVGFCVLQSWHQAAGAWLEQAAPFTATLHR